MNSPKPKKSGNKTVLLDQDGVLADFNGGFSQLWNQTMKDIYPAVPQEQRTHFYVEDDYPPQYRTEVESLIMQRGFYRHLPLIPGALEAIKHIESYGHSVWICTACHQYNPHCASEKLQWVGDYLGSRFLQRTILTRDKTMVYGDILIDDRPEISGSCPPQWQHLLFDQPYNRHCTTTRVRWDAEGIQLLLDYLNT